MSTEYRLTRAQQELELALGKIHPASDDLSHELFLFRAGQASAGSNRPWQMLSGVLTVLLIGALFSRIPGDKPQVIFPPEPVFVIQTAPSDVLRKPVSREPGEMAAYLNLREQVLERGMDALPAQLDTRGRILPKSRQEWLDSTL